MKSKLIKIKELILGFCIGIAIIVPGFSGAQTAIMFGLYDDLIESLSKIFKKKSLLFLFPILIGAIFGFLAGLISVKVFLKISTICVVFFFAGMMIGGLPSITDEIKHQKFKKRYIIYLLIGLLIPISISSFAIFSSINLNSYLINTPWWFYIVLIFIGMLLSFTQLIPGLSATSLLMSIGLYDGILNMISFSNIVKNPINILSLFLLAIGAIIGIVLFSKLINYLFKKYKISLYYGVIGLCISSIIVMFYNPEIISAYINGTNIHIHLSLGFLFLGFGFILSLFIYLKSIKNKEILKNE